ncbi:uncharacterized protein LOC123564718 [Mercenaria mercenaria]|uniref:uncharacterized protein LOC123564718 n=1 Tax=Mercenaria mercenaria TaxID=6596 RepID=UPI00234EA43F|nr:uncharacterized protein LOC123564718 [Mercenaria mercenaria]
MDKFSDGLPLLNENTSSASVDVHRCDTNDTDPDDLLFRSPLTGRETGLETGPETPTFPPTVAHALPIQGSDSFGRESSTDLARGKRKVDACENNENMRTRQKACRCANTLYSRGEKCKLPSDHSEQPRKRFKATPPEVEIEQPKTENTASLYNSIFGEGSNNIPNLDTSGFGESGIISHLQLIEEESRDEQSDQSVEGNSCPRSCVCKVGHSVLPNLIEREFPTAAPLYRSLLMCRLYSLSNTQYSCCKSRCVRRYPRESVVRLSLRHMIEDYYESDLGVTRYSWGEWKG